MAKTKQATTPKVPLTLATLGDLSNGAAAVVIDAALKAAIRDTEDRGEDKKARKVTIEVEMKKLGSENIATAVRAKVTIPPYLTESTIGSIRVNGSEVNVDFNPHSSENPDQLTMNLDDGDERSK